MTAVQEFTLCDGVMQDIVHYMEELGATPELVPITVDRWAAHKWIDVTHHDHPLNVRVFMVTGKR